MGRPTLLCALAAATVCVGQITPSPDIPTSPGDTVAPAGPTPFGRPSTPMAGRPGVDPGPAGPRVRADTDPIFLFPATGARAFGGVHLLTPHELARAIEDRTGVAVDVARLPAPIFNETASTVGLWPPHMPFTPGRLAWRGFEGGQGLLTTPRHFEIDATGARLIVVNQDDAGKIVVFGVDPGTGSLTLQSSRDGPPHAEFVGVLPPHRPGPASN